MFGVVLWSDEADRKAVFWCEDQGDLAFFEDKTCEFGSYSFFDAGDMVQFDIHVDRKLRKAHNARLVVEKACEELPVRLLTTASEPPPNASGPTTAKVLPFKRPGQKAAAPHVQEEAWADY